MQPLKSAQEEDNALPDPGRRTGVHGAIARYPLVSFIVLASRQGWVDWSVSTYLHLLGGLGPLVAGVLVVWALGGRPALRDLGRRMVAWRGRLRWLALAVLGPLGLFLLAVLAARILEGQWPDVSRFGASTEYPALPLLVFWLANFIFYGYGEEVGWRGFAQPYLQRGRSALRAAALVSVMWAGWHLPLVGITESYRRMPAIGFVGFYLSRLVGAFVLAWLYLRSAASILVVAAFHSAFDIATTTPTSTTLLPTLMGVAVTVAGIAVIPELHRRCASPSTVDGFPRRQRP